jgi:hypothetical protein
MTRMNLLTDLPAVNFFQNLGDERISYNTEIMRIHETGGSF